ncbi:MAG: ATP-binding protein [Desulfocapsaceae bacterium]|nr:ATP-binding protein [Desulfocapsaceae bacterium]
MSQQDDIIARLQSKLKARQKTIDVLMDAAEQRAQAGSSSLEILAQNVNLERVVQRKTEILTRQGDQLKQALHDLQLTQARLLQAQKLESVGQLAAGMAHEINTPAQFISSNIDFLEESFASTAQLIDMLQQVLQAISLGQCLHEAESGAKDMLAGLDWEYLSTEIPVAIRQSKDGIRRITTLVQAMKEFSLPGSKEMELHDLNRILQNTITVAKNEWECCADIETRFEKNLPQVFCLANEMGQVFLNILINAAHAITNKYPDRKEKGKITITTSSQPESVQVCMEDTGTGIPENIRSRIFDPFFTTKDVGTGSGQGLAISLDVIEKKHQGHLSFISETGKGTTFIVQLPTGNR